jgi:hypothetical protein
MYRSATVADAVLTSRLELLSNLKEFNQIDMKWENLLALKVMRFISVNLTVDFVYDIDTTDDIQIKEILGVGFPLCYMSPVARRRVSWTSSSWSAERSRCLAPAIVARNDCSANS